MAEATKKSSTKVKSKYNFPKETYLYWYESMLMMRRFEEKCGQLYGQQKIKGFCHLVIGQEACYSGAVSALKEGDNYITSYRCHGLPLALGTPADSIMAELYGKVTGCSKGKGGSMHIFDKSRGFVGGHGIVGAQIPLAAGLAFSEMYQGRDGVCVCYIGDGAVRQGAFHETLNMAMTWKIPVIFVIENNKYAMGTSVERTSNVVELYKLGSAYEMPSEPVDGMCVEEIHLAMSKAAERARSGNGPTLLEFNTYRYKGHSMSDPAKYRTKEELEEYKAQDPLEQVKATILENKFATEAELLELEKKIKETVLDSVKFAEDSPYPVAADAYNDVYVQTDYPYATD
jgi:pyruvate dehydrogenase E1 component alpha subunit